MMQAIQKAEQKGRAELTTITAASANNSFIHIDSTTTHPHQTSCHQCGYNHLRNNCPATGQKCHNCSGICHFSALCRTRTHRYDHRQNMHYQRRSIHHRQSSRSSSQESNTSPRRSRHSNSPGRHHTYSQHGSPHCTDRFRRSPTPYTHQINSITAVVQKPSEATSSNTDSKTNKSQQVQKQMCHPHPNWFLTFQSDSDSEDPYITTCSDRLFTFQSDSETEHRYSTTCNELLLSDTQSVTSSTLQTEDADNYKFLPFQDHIKPISRPSCIPILKT